MGAMMTKAVRPSEVEAMYSISHATLWRMMQKGDFPVYRVGRTVRIPLEEFEVWFKKRGKHRDL